MFLYNMARKVNKNIKKYNKKMAGMYLSPCRRIEFVAPPTNKKVVAMTFDDGPTCVETIPKVTNVGLTKHLINTLKDYNATATFDVIGTTKLNYPDEAGKLNSFTWGGVKYDHYPDINCDDLAGAVAQGGLIEELISEGHELANHGYRHLTFGPMKMVYGTRNNFRTVYDVVNDLKTLDDFILENFNYKMKLSRPPHYIDKIPDGYTSYDAYKFMGYNYMAASFDGGGWQASSGDYKIDVRKMVDPMKKALETDINSLNGQIIFQKDGFNMSRQTPIASALEKQLKLLTDAGYEVIPVSKLLALSPFEDLNDTDKNFKIVRSLINSGFSVGYKNNTFQKNRELTFGQMLIMCASPDAFLIDYQNHKENKVLMQAIKYLKDNNLIDNFGSSREKLGRDVTGNDILNLSMAMGLDIKDESFKDCKTVKRIDSMEFIYRVCEKFYGEK